MDTSTCGDGYTPEQIEILNEYYDEKYRSDWWKAIKALLTQSSDDYPWYWRIFCIIALLMGRGYSQKDKCYDYGQLAYFDYRQLYAGWECTLICYNPKSFRFSIESDGDWSM